MSDLSPPRIKVETTSLKSSLAFGIASIGAIPVRYNQPRFPALRRRFQEDTQEKRFQNIGGGRHPDMFALATVTSIGKPSNVQGGNQSAIRTGVNLTNSNGQRFRLHGAYTEITCSANVYAEKLDDLLLWITSAIEIPTIRGQCELTDDGGGFGIKVLLEPRFDWTDPVDASQSANSYLDRMYSTTVSFTINTIAARISSVPLFKTIIERVQIEGEPATAQNEIIIPATEIGDWP
jgi:hypothetical protein